VIHGFTFGAKHPASTTEFKSDTNVKFKNPTRKPGEWGTHHQRLNSKSTPTTEFKIND
jgi:hypothetical protein